MHAKVNFFLLFLFALPILAGCTNAVSSSDNDDDDYDNPFAQKNTQKAGPISYVDKTYSFQKDSTLHFSLNFIVAGKYNGTSDNVSIDSLAQRILERLNSSINYGFIVADKINILYASRHPIVGESFPDSKSYVFNRNEKDPKLIFMDNWENYDNNLDVILGYYVDEVNVMGFSPTSTTFFSNKFHLEHVSVGTHYYADTGKNILINMSSKTIADIVTHEIGHFMGLEHTTKSAPELKEKQNANADDGLDDTPFCHDLTLSERTYRKCPDLGYIMFPYYDAVKQHLTFTPEQIIILRNYLKKTSVQ